MPISAPMEQWTWVPFDDAFCANGTPTGIGVNLTDKSKRVLIYLQGGGACWSEFTCYTLKIAANFSTGYGPLEFMGDEKTLGSTFFFDRAQAGNPFKDYSFVFVPYCTGDVHAGSNTVTYGANKAMHVGWQNMTAYLARIVPTFPSPERIYVSGSSAGGYGAGFNWRHVQDAFGAAIRVDLIDDSGQPLPAPYAKDMLIQTWRTQWNLDVAFPPGCAECLTKFDALFDWYGKAYPNQRGALLSYQTDTVISQFYGISTAEFSMALDALETTRIDPYKNLHYFNATGMNHTLWGKPMVATNGVTVQQWLTQIVTDDPAWTSQHP